MLGLKNRKLRTKFMLLFLIVGIVPFAVLGVLAVHKAGQALKDRAYHHLITVREIKKQEIQKYFQQALTEMDIFSHSSDVLNLYGELAVYHAAENVQADGPYDVDTPEYKQIYQAYGANIRHFFKRRGYYDIFIICAEHGHVMFSCTRESDLGTNLQYGPYKNSGLADLWRQVVQSRAPITVDFKPYAPSNNEPAAFAGYPIFEQGQTGDLVGVIAFQFSIEHINEIMTQRDGMGQTGETYLIGPDQLMRSDSFMDPELFSVRNSFANPEIGKVTTEAALAALSGETGERIVDDYEGHQVLSAYAPLQIDGLNWAILAEMQTSEAFAEVRSLEWLIGLVAVAGILGILAVSFLFSRALSTPINQSVSFAQKIAEGDFTQSLSIKQADEIGLLSNALNSMATNLQGMIRQISEGVETLSASSTELSSISGQVSSNASQTTEKSGAVAASAEEMSTNMASVAAAAEQTSSNVSMVAAASEEMTATINEIAQNTEKARNITEEAVEESQQASKTVDELGKAAREIGKVTETITSNFRKIVL